VQGPVPFAAFDSYHLPETVEAGEMVTLVLRNAGPGEVTVSAGLFT
jgi:hypothetical protein